MFRLLTLKIGYFLIAVCVIQSGDIRKAAAQEGVFKVQIVADDMCCQGCAQKVAAQLYAAPGVSNVEADVSNRLVVVTAKPSPKLTLERLWQAVEQGKGGPSKLITAQTTYTFTRPDKLKPEQRTAAGHYSLTVREMRDNDRAQGIANRLYAIRGVKSVSVDLTRRMLLIESEGALPLSHWTLASAATAEDDLIAVNGPQGLLTVERSANAKPVSAARSTYSPVQGEVR